MNLTTSLLHIPMRNKDTGLVLLTTRVTILHGRYLQMKQIKSARSATKSSPNLRLEPPKGEDPPQDLTSDVFVYGRTHPDGSENTPPMSVINFDDLLGRPFLLPMDEIGEKKRATISDHVHTINQDKFQEKIN